MSAPEPLTLERPALFDTGAWTWVRDRRFPHLAEWFNAHVVAGRVLMCDAVALELIRLTPNQSRAREVSARLAALPAIDMPARDWGEVRATQLALAAAADHRRVPPVDLLIAAAATAAAVPVVHYDRDYVRISKVTTLDERWLVPEGSLA